MLSTTNYRVEGQDVAERFANTLSATCDECDERDECDECDKD